jgi:hypothetical protein
MAGVEVLERGNENFTYKRDTAADMLVLRSELFQTITQRIVITIYRRFGTTLSAPYSRVKQ